MRTSFGIKRYRRDVTSRLGSLMTIHTPVFRYFSENSDAVDSDVVSGPTDEDVFYLY